MRLSLPHFPNPPPVGIHAHVLCQSLYAYVPLETNDRFSLCKCDCFLCLQPPSLNFFPCGCTHIFSLLLLSSENTLLASSSLSHTSWGMCTLAHAPLAAVGFSLEDCRVVGHIPLQLVLQRSCASPHPKCLVLTLCAPSRHRFCSLHPKFPLHGVPLVKLCVSGTRPTTVFYRLTH